MDCRSYGDDSSEDNGGCMKKLWIIVIGMIFVSCGNHSNDPKSCRERVSRYITTIYENPEDLGKALDIVCSTTITIGG